MSSLSRCLQPSRVFLGAGDGMGGQGRFRRSSSSPVKGTFSRQRFRCAEEAMTLARKQFFP